MDGRSQTPQEIKLQQLKEIFPEAFAEGKIDWEKLKATLGEDVNFANERYVLNWAGKSDAFKVLQTPSTKTLVPDKEQSVSFDETEHIFIEGENLEVLKVLQKSYFGKVKMIYIDPPYNTGNDFLYSDKFAQNKKEYLIKTGAISEEGYIVNADLYKQNSKECGHFHSNWLNMIYPRLFLAKNLLRQDGVISISIDDNEVHNLRLMMNEIFGEENFISEVVWKKKHSHGRGQSFIIPQTEYILFYAKDANATVDFGINYSANKVKEFKYADFRGKYRLLRLWHTSPTGAYERKTLQYRLFTPDGELVDNVSGQWLWSEKRMYEEIKNENVVFERHDSGSIRAFKKDYLSDDRQEKPTSLYEKATTDDATKEFNCLLPDVQQTMFTKPKKLINNIIDWVSSDSNDIILDFFAGSGTTFHAIMQLNAEDGGKRKCISVQLPEIINKKTEAYKAGYKTIADIAKERMRRAGKKTQEEITEKIKAKEKEIEELNGELTFEEKQQKIEDLKIEIEQLQKQDLGFKVLKLSDSNFKQWQQIEGKDAEALEKQMELFVDPVSENATTENMVYELLLKSGKDLNSKLEHKENYYCVNNNELIFMLEKATQEIVDSVIAEKPQKIIALDRLFKDNDQLKTNTSLQMRDAGIEFKTI
jgi:adenine-specific DNA-methyltransferase